MNELLLIAACATGLNNIIIKSKALAKKSGTSSLVAENLRITLMNIVLIILLLNVMQNALKFFHGTQGVEIFYMSIAMFWLAIWFTNRDLKVAGNQEKREVADHA